MKKSGAGNDFVGWVEWPNSYDHEEFERIKVAAKRLEGQCDVLLVCGIGGSYLGARAAIEMMRGLYCQTKPEVIFIGNTFSSTYFKQVEAYIQDKGNRAQRHFQIRDDDETAMAFRMLKQLMEKKYSRKNVRSEFWRRPTRRAAL